MALDKTQMQAIAAPYTTVSDKIRALDAAGAPRAQIATFLGKRYQHIRNVLMHHPPKGSPFVRSYADVSGVSETPTPPYAAEADSVLRLPIAEDGSVRLPPEALAALGVQPGGLIIGVPGEEGLLLLSLPESVRRVQAMVRAMIPEGHSLVDALIADRRREAAEDDG